MIKPSQGLYSCLAAGRDQVATLADMTASVTAFEEQEALMGLFQQAVASLLSNEVLASLRPDVISALEGMVEQDEHGTDMLKPALTAYLKLLQETVLSALKKASKPETALEDVEYCWMQWMKEDSGGGAAMSAFMISSHLERLHAVKLADAVHDVMLQDKLPSQVARVWY